MRAQAENTKSGGKPVIVVPVGLSRTNWFLPYAAPMLKRSRLAARVVFGKPILPDAFIAAGGVKPAEQIIIAVEQEIRRLSGQ